MLTLFVLPRRVPPPPPPEVRKDKHRAKENIIRWGLHDPRLVDAALTLLLYETFTFAVIVMLRYLILLGRSVPFTCLLRFCYPPCTPDTLLSVMVFGVAVEGVAWWCMTQ